MSEDSKKIEEGLFDDLVRYARANGWHSGVYSGLLRHRGRSSGNARQEDEHTSLLPHGDGPMNGVGSGAVGSSRKRRGSRKTRMLVLPMLLIWCLSGIEPEVGIFGRKLEIWARD